MRFNKIKFGEVGLQYFSVAEFIVELHLLISEQENLEEKLILEDEELILSDQMGKSFMLSVHRRRNRLLFRPAMSIRLTYRANESPYLLDILVGEVDYGIAIGEHLPLNPIRELDFFLSVLVDTLDLPVFTDILQLNTQVLF